MKSPYNLSPGLLELLDYATRELQAEVILNRRTDIPAHGLLVDDYTYFTGKHVIAFSNSQLGMLKDYTITRHCLHLLVKGMAAQRQEYRVISYSSGVALAGCQQVYLDVLKDEVTRNMEIWRKKQILFLLYTLIHEALAELPWNLLCNIVIARKYPAMRNAQVYFLLKESMRDMHDLVPVKDFIPQRYFVLHNAMYYARDMILAYILSEYKLNPVINIPELQRFRNLDMKEMMTQRWSRSPWYHTKMVGDAMANMLELTITADLEAPYSRDYFRELYHCGMDLVNRWLVMVGMQDWYVWETPERHREILASGPAMEKSLIEAVFGPE
jgi:hypothetical protein